jgi:hypothetical protein
MEKRVFRMQYCKNKKEQDVEEIREARIYKP